MSETLVVVTAKKRWGSMREFEREFGREFGRLGRRRGKVTRAVSIVERLSLIVK